LADQLQQWNAAADSVLLGRMDAAMEDLFGRWRSKPAA
jgi:hypothetical protein